MPVMHVLVDILVLDDVNVLGQSMMTAMQAEEANAVYKERELSCRWEACGNA